MTTLTFRFCLPCDRRETAEKTKNREDRCRSEEPDDILGVETKRRVKRDADTQTVTKNRRIGDCRSSE